MTIGPPWSSFSYVNWELSWWDNHLSSDLAEQSNPSCKLWQISFEAFLARSLISYRSHPNCKILSILNAGFHPIHPHWQNNMQFIIIHLYNRALKYLLKQFLAFCLVLVGCRGYKYLSDIELQDTISIVILSDGNLCYILSILDARLSSADRLTWY